MAATLLLLCNSIFRMGEICCEILGKEHFFEGCDASRYFRKLLRGKNIWLHPFFQGKLP